MLSGLVPCQDTHATVRASCVKFIRRMFTYLIQNVKMAMKPIRKILDLWTF